MGLSPAAQLPRRDRGRHLVPQARLRPDALHLARHRALQILYLAVGRRQQSRDLRAPQARLAKTEPRRPHHRRPPGQPARLKPARKTPMLPATLAAAPQERPAKRKIGSRRRFKLRAKFTPTPKTPRLWPGTSLERNR